MLAAHPRSSCAHRSASEEEGNEVGTRCDLERKDYYASASFFHAPRVLAQLVPVKEKETAVLTHQIYDLNIFEN